MKIRLLDYGGRCPERAHANDAGTDVFSPRDLDFWFLMDMRVLYFLKAD